MKFKVWLKMEMDDVRRICIENGWYTRGTNEQYSKMLEMANGEVTDSDVVKIAEDIYNHSEADCGILTIAWYLRNKAVTTFYEEV